MHYFGSVNIVLRDYFDITYATYATVDWFSISSIPASGLFSGVWTFLSVTKAQQFRRMSIISTGCALMGCLCTLISFIWRRLYAFAYIGSIFNGVLSGFLLIAPVSFTVLSFPDSETGTAISVRFVNTRLGLLLAFLIPSRILSPISCNNKIRNLNSSAYSSFINCKKL